MRDVCYGCGGVMLCMLFCVLLCILEAVEESEVAEVMRRVLLVGVCRPRVIMIGIFWIRTVLSVLQYPR